MRKRKAARPVLESMEGRLVPSIASALNPFAAVSSAIAALTPAHHSRDAAAHDSKSEGKAQHPHATKLVHTTTHHSSTSSSSSGSVSSFFKSVFGGL
jgi:hypothetical protein